mmetsp:Transcript_3804/g.10936  ORF Transcript_3804/g.10936 Transcript_3804/m.10936 type:complete len:758 (-) Transcript_3804:1267-3540(-)
MLVALAALLLISGALAGVADVNYGSDSLRVATDAANPPYSPSPGSSDVGGQPVLPAANERVFVQQTRGFGDVRTPSPLPPLAPGGGLPALDAPASPWGGVNANQRDAAGPLPKQITICNSIRICSGSTRIKLHGVNWFGFETGQTMVDGLWQGPTAMTLDFITVTRRIKKLGFNTVRLPFSMTSLFEQAPRSYTINCPTSGANPTPQQILSSIKKPGLSTGSMGDVSLTWVPNGALSTDGSGGSCNGYLPNDTTLSRFLWVIGFLARNNFVIMIDNHLNLDTSILDNRVLWLSRWKKIMSEVNKDSYSRRRVIFDVLNEPDAQALRWEAQAGKPGMSDAYHSVMAAAYSINPNFLVAIEGLGQGALGANWGDGLATADSVLAGSGASDPNPFFRKLMTKPYRKNVIIAPHIYPPSITSQRNPTLLSAPGLYNHLSNSFGYLNKKGYCYNGNCQRFPVVIGEMGSRLRDCRNRCAVANCMYDELTVMNLFLNYFKAEGSANDGRHEAIDAWYWWSWNANSGDTGGVVDDDWKSVIWQKVSYMGRMGLTPWYASKCGSNCFASLPTSAPDACQGSCGGGPACGNGSKCINGSCCSSTNACGNTCCSSGKSCVNGSCTSACSASQRCGSKCCESGTACYDGSCVAAKILKNCGGTMCKAGQACASSGKGCCSKPACGNITVASKGTCCDTGGTSCKLAKLQRKYTCCPQKQQCGKYCCGATQSCRNNACCSAVKVCGNTCCPTGKSCVRTALGEATGKCA